jgi:(1->4)-alpha-D-glucan 1-alpha-D-glucosylmutase
VRERLVAYIQKAVREAKVSTSWMDPDTAYEEAISAFIGALLDPASPARYLRDVTPLIGEVGASGLWNALSRLVVHLTAPGVPDVYQGDELWFQALVDPDNRRPVDWELRSARLAEVRNACDQGLDGVPAPDILRRWREQMDDGMLKLYLTNRLLRLRRDESAAFVDASYTPLRADGAFGKHILAYRRGEGLAARVVLVSRLTAAFGPGAPIGAPWGDTRLRVDHGAEAWRGLLSGATILSRDGAIDVASAFGELPVAVLAPTNSAQLLKM